MSGIFVYFSTSPRTWHGLVLTIALVILTIVPEHSAGQSTGRTIEVGHDRFGLTTPDSTGIQRLEELHSGDRVRVIFNPTRVFDTSSLDTVRKERALTLADRNPIAFFIYPEDAFLLDFKRPLQQLASLHPGTTDFYVAGKDVFRLRVVPMTAAEVQHEIPKDTQTVYQSYYKQQLDRCYRSDDAHVIGRAEIVEGPLHAALLSGTGFSGYNTWVFHDIPIGFSPDSPYVRIELLQEIDTPEGCTGSTAGLSGAAPILKVAGFVLATVAPDFTSARVVFRSQKNGEVREDSVDLTAVGPHSSALAATTPALEPGPLEHRICERVDPRSGMRRILGNVTERCLPMRPITARVGAPLPGPIRLQPGIVAVDSWRDVRLTANVVFIMNRNAYYGQEPRSWRNLLGGTINPTAGLQFGGTDSQLVLLMGAHIRFVEEAGLIAGLRFGNDRSVPYRWGDNFYVGVSFDPAILANLRSSRP